MVMTAAVVLLAAVAAMQGAQAQQRVSAEFLNSMKAMLDSGTGQTAADFTVAEVNGGGSVALAQLRGKVVLLNFWATWCPPCRAELAHMVNGGLLKRLAAKPDFVFLPVSNEKAATVAKFLADNGYQFSAYTDNGAGVSGSYGVSGIPTSFLIDRDGKILYKAVGFGGEIEQGLLDAIDAALAK